MIARRRGMPPFAEMAEFAGLPRKLAYGTAEVAKATGYSARAVSEACQTGNLESYVPRGMKRGRLMTPEMVDDWLRGGA